MLRHREKGPLLPFLLYCSEVPRRLLVLQPLSLRPVPVGLLFARELGMGEGLLPHCPGQLSPRS